MTDPNDTAPPSPKFDPVRLEQLNVAKDYPMEPDDFEMLYKHNCYCEMAHINNKGYPIVTPMFYVIVDGFLYMSSIQKYRHKMHHLQRNPKISVSIHNDGSNVRRQKAILIIGQAETSTDDALMRKVHWAIIDKYWWELKDEAIRQSAFSAVHTPLRILIKVIPEKTMSWDLGKMVEAYEPGVWYGESYNMVKDLPWPTRSPKSRQDERGETR
ncbi:MAG: pyridoxamine 5'-phosphate oxidase [Gammaproteobacteria bacterium]|nr:pyridoxamine 5'-phosphate oxidase [Gammaproteobacteria bacterium]MBM4220814.1 pyridoxamine 5'-phosphate oxidase [Gammaproteobacteria bacterium]